MIRESDPEVIIVFPLKWICSTCPWCPLR